MVAIRLPQKIPETTDAEVVATVRAALTKLKPADFVIFVRHHPTAQVQDFSDELLGGVILEAQGPTRQGYLRVYRRLVRARKKLGLPAPWKRSVRRFRHGTGASGATGLSRLEGESASARPGS